MSHTRASTHTRPSDDDRGRGIPRARGAAAAAAASGNYRAALVREFPAEFAIVLFPRIWVKATNPIRRACFGKEHPPRVRRARRVVKTVARSLAKYF